MRFLATALCAVVNALLMLWIAYGDESRPAFLRPGPVVDILYAIFWFVMIYFFLSRENIKLRQAAQSGVLMAWLFMAFLVSFKIKEDPFAAVRIYAGAFFVMFMHIPGERFVAWLRSVSRSK